MNIRLITVLIALSALMGCASGREDKPGPAIDIYPTVASLALQTDAIQKIKSNEALNMFMAQNHQALMTQEINLLWSTSQGKEFAQEAAAKLRLLGVEVNHLRIEKMASGFGQHFDFRLELLSHRVVAPVCQYVKIGQFGQEGKACFTESARWQSMVRPERMLRTTPALPVSSLNAGE